jgi:uncharacterized protein
VQEKKLLSCFLYEQRYCMNDSHSPLPSPSLDSRLFETSLLEILACPITKTRLHYDVKAQELISHKAGLAFPIRNGIPILLKEEARVMEEAVRPTLPHDASE